MAGGPVLGRASGCLGAFRGRHCQPSQTRGSLAPSPLCPLGPSKPFKPQPSPCAAWCMGAQPSSPGQARTHGLSHASPSPAKPRPPRAQVPRGVTPVSSSTRAPQRHLLAPGLCSPWCSPAGTHQGPDLFRLCSSKPFVSVRSAKCTHGPLYLSPWSRPITGAG